MMRRLFHSQTGLAQRRWHSTGEDSWSDADPGVSAEWKQDWSMKMWRFWMINPQWCLALSSNRRGRRRFNVTRKDDFNSDLPRDSQRNWKTMYDEGKNRADKMCRCLVAFKSACKRTSNNQLPFSQLTCLLCELVECNICPRRSCCSTEPNST